MKVRELINELSKLDPELVVVSRINKHYTYREVREVEAGMFDEQSGVFNGLGWFDDDVAPDAVAVKD